MKTPNPKKEKKSPRTEEENIKIHATIESFRGVNDGINVAFKRPTERQSAWELILKYSAPSIADPSKTKLESMVEFLPIYNLSIKPKKDGKDGYGTIKKPTQMLDFVEDLKSFKRKYDLERLYEKKQKEQEENDRKYFEEQKRILDEMPPEEKERLRRERNEKMLGIIKGKDLTIRNK